MYSSFLLGSIESTWKHTKETSFYFRIKRKTLILLIGEFLYTLFFHAIIIPYKFLNIYENFHFYCMDKKYIIYKILFHHNIKFFTFKYLENCIFLQTFLKTISLFLPLSPRFFIFSSSLGYLKNSCKNNFTFFFYLVEFLIFQGIFIV